MYDVGDKRALENNILDGKSASGTGSHVISFMPSFFSSVQY